MSNANGFILLHRKMLNWEWYDEPNVRSVFIHLLLLANYKPSRWHGEEIGPGQLITSYAHLQKRLGLSYSQVRTAMEKLQSTGEIQVKSTTKYTLVTIANWAFYQNAEEKIDNQSTTNPQRIDNQSTHHNNVNNINNVKKYKAPPRLHVYDTSQYDFEAIRKRAREKIREKISNANAG